MTIIYSPYYPIYLIRTAQVKKNPDNLDGAEQVVKVPRNPPAGDLRPGRDQRRERCHRRGRCPTGLGTPAGQEEGGMI